MAKRPSAFEQGKPDLPDGIKIECWMAGALIGNIKRLARPAENTPDAQDRGCLVLSAFLIAGAALEATGMTRADRTLVILLRFIGVSAVFARVASSCRCHGWSPRIGGWGEMPTPPVGEYLARYVSAFYALFGALCRMVASGLNRYRPLVRFLGVAIAVMGVVLIARD
jgi:hypothetical protein